MGNGPLVKSRRFLSLDYQRALLALANQKDNLFLTRLFHRFYMYYTLSVSKLVSDRFFNRLFAPSTFPT